MVGNLPFKNWKLNKKVAKERLDRNVKFYVKVLDYYQIDKTIHLPVFKLDRKLSYRMNELFPNRIFGFSNINPRSKEWVGSFDKWWDKQRKLCKDIIKD